MENNVYSKANGLSAAALIFGILALLGSFLVIPTPFNASMAIMFSWLSRGDKKMNRQALAGNILALASIVISLTVCVILMTVFITALLSYIGNLDLSGLEAALKSLADSISIA